MRIDKTTIIVGSCAVAIIACIAVTAGYLISHKKPAKEEVTAEEETIDLSFINVPDENGSYIRDVAYDGSEPVDLAVFQYPFKFGDSETYVPNKLIVQQREDVYIKGAADYTKKALEQILGTGYRELKEDPDGFKESVSQYFLEGSADIYNRSAEDIIDHYVDYIIENEIQSEVTVDTARYLVYEDCFTYVRGVLNVTNYHSNVESTLDELPVELARDGRYVFEAALNYNGSKNDDVFFLFSFKTLGEIKLEEEGNDQ